MAMYGVSIVVSFQEWDVTNNVPKTGDAANISTYWTKDGTQSATTNSCSEVSSTNSPGEYKITMTSTECSCLFGTITGKSSTSGCYVMQKSIAFEYIPNAAAGANGGLPTVDANNQVKGNVTSLLGTAWLTPSVAGTPDVNTKLIAGQAAQLDGNNLLKIDLVDIAGAAVSTTSAQLGVNVVNYKGSSAPALTTNGNYPSGLAEVISTTLTESSAGYLAAAIKKFFNVASPTSTLNEITLVDTVTALTNAPQDSPGIATIEAAIAALNNLSSSQVSTAVGGASMGAKYNNHTRDDAIKFLLALADGAKSGLDTGSIIWKTPDGSTNILTGTGDASGNYTPGTFTP